MSSPSKARRARREWMKRERDEMKRHVVAAERRAFSEGARLMRDDMMAVVPTEEERRSGGYDRKYPIETLYIPQFPDPRERGSVFVVPVPDPVDRVFQGRVGSTNHRIRTVVFRPIMNRITFGGPTNETRLEWLHWEPEKGSKEIEDRTMALTSNVGKLAFVRSLLEYTIFDRSVLSREEIAKAAVLVGEAVDEMRRLLGRFAPEPVLSREEAVRKFLFQGFRR